MSDDGVYLWDYCVNVLLSARLLHSTLSDIEACDVIGSIRDLLEYAPEEHWVPSIIDEVVKKAIWILMEMSTVGHTPLPLLSTPVDSVEVGHRSLKWQRRDILELELLLKNYKCTPKSITDVRKWTCVVNSPINNHSCDERNSEASPVQPAEPTSPTCEATPYDSDVFKVLDAAIDVLLNAGSGHLTPPSNEASVDEMNMGQRVCSSVQRVLSEAGKKNQDLQQAVVTIFGSAATGLQIPSVESDVDLMVSCKPLGEANENDIYSVVDPSSAEVAKRQAKRVLNYKSIPHDCLSDMKIIIMQCRGKAKSLIQRATRELEKLDQEASAESDEEIEKDATKYYNSKKGKRHSGSKMKMYRRMMDESTDMLSHTKVGLERVKAICDMCTEPVDTCGNTEQNIPKCEDIGGTTNFINISRIRVENLKFYSHHTVLREKRVLEVPVEKCDREIDNSAHPIHSAQSNCDEGDVDDTENVQTQSNTLSPSLKRTKNRRPIRVDEESVRDRALLRTVKKALSRNGFRILEVVLQARIPLVKFETRILMTSSDVPNTHTSKHDKNTLYKSVSCDITPYRRFPVVNSAFLRAYIDWSACTGGARNTLKLLLMLVKMFAKHKNIGSAADGYLSSYAWVLMSMHVLLRKGLIPMFQYDVNEEFGFKLLPDSVRNNIHTMPLCLLFYEVMNYYANEYDCMRHTVTLRGSGEVVDKRCWDKPVIWRISIEDPFEFCQGRHPRDLGVTVRAKTQAEIFKTISYAERVTRKLLHCSDKTLVGSAFDEYYELFAPLAARSITGVAINDHQSETDTKKSPRNNQGVAVNDRKSKKGTKKSPRNNQGVAVYDHQSEKDSKESPGNNQGVTVNDRKSKKGTKKSPRNNQGVAVNDHQSEKDSKESPPNNQGIAVNDRKSKKDSKKSPRNNQGVAVNDRKSKKDSIKSPPNNQGVTVNDHQSEKDSKESPGNNQGVAVNVHQSEKDSKKSPRNSQGVAVNDHQSESHTNKTSKRNKKTRESKVSEHKPKDTAGETDMQHGDEARKNPKNEDNPSLPAHYRGKGVNKWDGQLMEGDREATQVKVPTHQEVNSKPRNRRKKRS